ncbi:hypothetical protein ABMA28_014520 [Loxostege sticticalis]|uniref:Glutathione transferase n=1 Tax=Loxostege sticticalis TaxID=481309 RepID=A0ABD0TH39_LOXSC
MSLVLYRVPGSPPARSVMMLGDLLRLRLEYRDVNLLRNEHKSQEFRKMNPMGTVPVLQDGDFILSESHAILKYLLTNYGSAEQQERLYPSESKARALVDQSMFFNSGYLFPRVGTIMLDFLLRGAPLPSPAKLEAMDEAYGVLEAYLQSRRFVAADHFTLADLSVGAVATAGLLLRKLDKDKFPRCADWLQELEEMPCFKNINAEGLANLKKVMEKAIEMHKKKAQN